MNSFSKSQNEIKTAKKQNNSTNKYILKIQTGKFTPTSLSKSSISLITIVDVKTRPMHYMYIYNHTYVTKKQFFFTLGNDIKNYLITKDTHP